MNAEDRKIAHLGFLQSIIARMANNSFLLKGWAVTLLAAIAAAIAAKWSPELVLIAYLPVIAFWYLDAWFLRQEKMYRKLYDDVRARSEEQIDFLATPNSTLHVAPSVLQLMFSVTLGTFYGALIVGVVALNVLFCCKV